MADPSDDQPLPISCVLVNCNKTTSTCDFTCVPSPDPFLSPSPPSPVSGNSSQAHFAPFLIAIVCFLGISFLLLTTCTIILRYRFKLRRRNSVTNDETLIEDNNDGGIGGGVDHPIWYIQTVGLQQSVIDSITAFKYKKVDGFLIDGSNSGVNNCAVCLSDFDDGDDVRLLPKCCHCFHMSCIDTWLRSHKTCPICRAPVVNESGVSAVVGGGLGSGDSMVGSDDVTGGLEENNDGFVELGVVESGCSPQLCESGDGFVALDIAGLKIDEVLKRNKRLRILSDLGENYRFSEKEEGVEPIRRSFSFNALVAATSDKNESSVCIVGNEGYGCSSNANVGRVLPEKISIEKGSSKRGSSFSGTLTKSPSVGPSLQKGPVSMKRSRSSSGGLFSFRKTRNQALILPL